MNDLVRYGIMGVSGAVAVGAIDGTVTRVDALNTSRIGRAAARLALAGIVAWAAHKAKAPEPVVGGVLVGAVLVTALDAAVSLIPRNRVDPPPIPPGTHAGLVGLPWGPQPAYAVSPTVASSAVVLSRPLVKALGPGA